ncbi:hypothetical protein PSHT_15353 [Puccinia striiformis]|uniref:Uncharacterized protein n=1 Tax=Puccinia striiformis TaxID=27350 RepID=A0A2S4UFT0_9BASI|nr:hypothetical protein PSHT_15353 [Puccinia striiformis]
MDFDHYDQPVNVVSASGRWELEILPAMASSNQDDSASPPGQQLRSHPASGAVVYNRTILWKNRQQVLVNPSVHQRGEPDEPPTTYRYIIHWTESLCLELIQFFGAWYQRHIDLVNRASIFLMRATYADNFEDVLRAYPRLHGKVGIMEMTGQYVELCKKWMTVKPEENLSVNDRMAYISGKGMSPFVYALLKNAIENKRHIENPPVIVATPNEWISRTSAACASFLAQGLWAEMKARAAENDLTRAAVPIFMINYGDFGIKPWHGHAEKQ